MNNQHLPSNCDHCALRPPGLLKQMGVEIGTCDYVVALAGNPNTGKSTVFNALTGLRQHTGNWPGKTVSRAEGAFEYEQKRYKLVDLPGTYSLLSTSEDEEIARDFILFGRPDVTVIVADASRLERNLNLVLQIVEITDRAILCLNLMDEARRHQITIDERELVRRLGIPVVMTAARAKEGIPQLLQTIDSMARGDLRALPHRIKGLPHALEEAVERVTVKLQAAYPTLTNCRWVALRLLEGDPRIEEALIKGEFIS